MMVPETHYADLRDLIVDFYERPLSQGTMDDQMPRLSRLVGVDYFGLFAVGSYLAAAHNSPDDYCQTYLSVQDADYMAAQALSGNEFVLSRRPEIFLDRRNRAYNAVCQEGRPVTDTVYLPIRLDSRVCGFFALARKGETSGMRENGLPKGRPFTNQELEIIRFVGSFVTDSFARMNLRPPAEGSTAQMNRSADILSEGSMFREIRQSLGAGQWQHFIRAYRTWVRQPWTVGADWVCLRRGAQEFMFHFTLLSGSAVTDRDTEYAQVRVMDRSLPRSDSDLESFSNLFGLTPREREVVDGLLKGHSNKQIAFELGVEESTVKRHTHNIYDKTGFTSRVELVLGIR